MESKHNTCTIERYLKQFEIALVREVGMERAVVHKNARHIVILSILVTSMMKALIVVVINFISEHRLFLKN